MFPRPRSAGGCRYSRSNTAAGTEQGEHRRNVGDPNIYIYIFYVAVADLSITYKIGVYWLPFVHVYKERSVQFEAVHSFLYYGKNN